MFIVNLNLSAVFFRSVLFCIFWATSSGSFKQISAAELKCENSIWASIPCQYFFKKILVIQLAWYFRIEYNNIEKAQFVSIWTWWWWHLIIAANMNTLCRMYLLEVHNHHYFWTSQQMNLDMICKPPAALLQVFNDHIKSCIIIIGVDANIFARWLHKTHIICVSIIGTVQWIDEVRFQYVWM